MIKDSTKLHIDEKMHEERRESDSRYAIKLVERIVFAILSITGLAVLAKFLGLINL